MRKQIHVDLSETERVLGIPRDTLKLNEGLGGRLPELPTNPATLVGVRFSYQKLDKTRGKKVVCLPAGAVENLLSRYDKVDSVKFYLSSENDRFPSPALTYQGFIHPGERGEGEYLELAQVISFDGICIVISGTRDRYESEKFYADNPDYILIGVKAVPSLNPIEFSPALVESLTGAKLTPDEPCVNIKGSGERIIEANRPKSDLSAATTTPDEPCANTTISSGTINAKKLIQPEVEIELSEALLKAAYLLGGVPEAKEIKRTLLKYGKF